MAQLFAMVVKKDFYVYKTDGSGDIERTIKNALKQPMKSEHWNTFSDMKTEIEGNDPSCILIQLTETQYNFYRDPVNMWIDLMTSMPMWQYNETLDEIGHWDDPGNMQSVWNEDVSISDDRFRITIRHDVNLDEPTGSSPFLDEIKVDQEDKTVGGADNRITLRFEIRNEDNVLVGNGRQEFFNGYTPSVIYLTNGIGVMYIDTTIAHKRRAFRSNHTFRIDNAKRRIEIIIFSKQVNDN